MRLSSLWLDNSRSTSSRWLRMTCACRYSTVPAVVGTTPAFERLSNLWLKCSSSEAMCWLNADCASCSWLAAAERLLASTAVTKLFSVLKFTVIGEESVGSQHARDA